MKKTERVNSAAIVRTSLIALPIVKQPGLTRRGRVEQKSAWSRKACVHFGWHLSCLHFAPTVVQRDKAGENFA